MFVLKHFLHSRKYKIPDLAPPRIAGPEHFPKEDKLDDFFTPDSGQIRKSQNRQLPQLCQIVNTKNWTSFSAIWNGFAQENGRRVPSGKHEFTFGAGRYELSYVETIQFVYNMYS